MRAVCWQGSGKVGVESVADPRLLNPRDAIIEVSSAAICGSDLHLYNGKVPSMMQGDILGHEFMGTVVDLGSAVRNLHIGDRVVVPFNIACGSCRFCKQGEFSLCGNSNPNAWLGERMNGAAGGGLFGFTHLYGGYAGGQAEYVRVPFADVGPVKVSSHLSDEQVLFLSDILPTGYMAAEHCQIKPGDTVAVWGCGPVGQMAIQSAWMLGAGRVFAIDQVRERLDMARREGRAEVINFDQVDPVHALLEATGGIGPDSCIEAVGMEAHGHSLSALIDHVKQRLIPGADRLAALRQALFVCRKGGTVSIPGVYSGLGDSLNLGAAFAKGVTLKMGQTHTHRYMRPLLERIESGAIDPSFVVSHRMSLEDAAQAYDLFDRKSECCTKVVLKPKGVVLDEEMEEEHDDEDYDEQHGVSETRH